MHELLTATTTRVIDDVVLTYHYNLELFNSAYFGSVVVRNANNDDVFALDVYIDTTNNSIKTSAQFEYRGYYQTAKYTSIHAMHARATLRKMIANNA